MTLGRLVGLGCCRYLRNGTPRRLPPGPGRRNGVMYLLHQGQAREESMAKVKANPAVAISLIAGIGFIIAAFFKFHQHKQNPQIRVTPISNLAYCNLLTVR